MSVVAVAMQGLEENENEEWMDGLGRLTAVGTFFLQTHVRL